MSCYMALSPCVKKSRPDAANTRRVTFFFRLSRWCAARQHGVTTFELLEYITRTASRLLYLVVLHAFRRLDRCRERREEIIYLPGLIRQVGQPSPYCFLFDSVCDEAGRFSTRQLSHCNTSHLWRTSSSSWATIFRLVAIRIFFSSSEHLQARSLFSNIYSDITYAECMYTATHLLNSTYIFRVLTCYRACRAMADVD